MSENQTIVIKKIKKGGHGHHGGAWKLAYADFVTAMMAFFLLMWLLGTTEPSFRQGIADYFTDPWKPSIAGGANTGDATSLIQGGGQDVTQSEGQVKLTNEGKQESIADASDKDVDEEAERRDINHLKQLKEKIDNLIETTPLMNQYKDQLMIDFTSEGLRIQIMDQEKKAMFNRASAKMESYAAQILDQLAPVINELPNRISVSGHTDSAPFPGNGQGYTNWELSADRANAARKELVRGGLKDEKIIRVVGLASSVHMNKDNPLDPINRRISIIVLNRRTEEGIINSANVRDFAQKKLLNSPSLPPPPSVPEIKPPVPQLVSH
ncbi:flagellar motor protein MotB [Candidatus Methylomicrobium oryzae]|uniref:flagellar motor protein MotB n=1 Tax=Candidatus Methylomicrobium oryzae TaxID=2802053 RepID=UPI001922456D|nr:flagellar motor protein MotB [Methylomicrobium sp. RS1]MBL1265163.1 flagellar motor protein MotB [Methylomicrobium sp. RS1]